MGAAHILQVVDWSKYTLDEWLAQYGAWCGSESTRRPNSLSTSQSYYLMVSTGAVKPSRASRSHVTCNITDDEARAVGRILNDVLNGRSFILKNWIRTLIAVQVELASQREYASLTCVSRASVEQDIQCARAYLHGRYGFLKID